MDLPRPGDPLRAVDEAIRALGDGGAAAAGRAGRANAVSRLSYVIIYLNCQILLACASGGPIGGEARRGAAAAAAVAGQARQSWTSRVLFNA